MGCWHAVQQAIRLYRDDPPAWRRLATAGMAQDFSWEASARGYLGLYEEALADRQVASRAAIA